MIGSRSRQPYSEQLTVVVGRGAGWEQTKMLPMVRMRGIQKPVRHPQRALCKQTQEMGGEEIIINLGAYDHD